jgi:hypothetical protein
LFIKLHKSINILRTFSVITRRNATQGKSPRYFFWQALIANLQVRAMAEAQLSEFKKHGLPDNAQTRQLAISNTGGL